MSQVPEKYNEEYDEDVAKAAFELGLLLGNGNSTLKKFHLNHGHMALVSAAVTIARAFREATKGVDWKSGEYDYILEYDEFIHKYVEENFV